MDFLHNLYMTKDISQIAYSLLSILAHDTALSHRYDLSIRIQFGEFLSCDMALLIWLHQSQPKTHSIYLNYEKLNLQKLAPLNIKGEDKLCKDS